MDSLETDVLEMEELDTVFDYLLQRLVTEDHISLFTAAELELFDRANANGFDTEDFVARMRTEYGSQGKARRMD